MLELKDFFHHPQVDALVLAKGPGLIVVAGVGTRTAPRLPPGRRFCPAVAPPSVASGCDRS